MPQPGLKIGGRMVEVQDRTRESFQRLASAQLPALYWLARRLVRDGAEDLVQEALLRAYRSYGTLRDDTAAGPWLKRILVNVFRDQLRRQARSPEELPVDQVEDFSLYQTLVEQDPLPYSDTLHHDYLRAFAREDVREVLLRLPELYRAPLVLRYMDGFATKEIARLLDVPLGTVLARLIGVASGSNRSCGRTPRRPDSSSGGQCNDREPRRDPVLGGGAAAVGLPGPGRLPRGPGQRRAAPVVLP
jgi:RNA polymerase sigma-70 factor (ECF subfamily)